MLVGGGSNSRFNPRTCWVCWALIEFQLPTQNRKEHRQSKTTQQHERDTQISHFHTTLPLIIVILQLKKDNDFISSDPHHDMSGRGCQVRVVRSCLYQQSKHRNRTFQPRAIRPLRPEAVKSRWWHPLPLKPTHPVHVIAHGSTHANPCQDIKHTELKSRALNEASMPNHRHAILFGCGRQSWVNERARQTHWNSQLAPNSSWSMCMCTCVAFGSGTALQPQNMSAHLLSGHKRAGAPSELTSTALKIKHAQN